jgi:hypothetical protein
MFYTLFTSVPENSFNQYLFLFVLSSITLIVGPLIQFKNVYDEHFTEFSTYGVKRRGLTGIIEISWGDVRSTKLSFYNLYIYTSTAKIKINLSYYRKPDEVAKYIRSCISHLG